VGSKSQLRSPTTLKVTGKSAHVIASTVQRSNRELQHLYPLETAAGISRPKFLAVLSMGGSKQFRLVFDKLLKVNYVLIRSSCSLSAVHRQVVLAVLLLHKWSLNSAHAGRRRLVGGASWIKLTNSVT
jgi:hypothetical protein